MKPQTDDAWRTDHLAIHGLVRDAGLGVPKIDMWERPDGTFFLRISLSDGEPLTPPIERRPPGDTTPSRETMQTLRNEAWSLARSHVEAALESRRFFASIPGEALPPIE